MRRSFALYDALVFCVLALSFTTWAQTPSLSVQRERPILDVAEEFRVKIFAEPTQKARLQLIRDLKKLVKNMGLGGEDDEANRRVGFANYLDMISTRAGKVYSVSDCASAKHHIIYDYGCPHCNYDDPNMSVEQDLTDYVLKSLAILDALCHDVGERAPAKDKAGL